MNFSRFLVTSILINFTLLSGYAKPEAVPIWHRDYASAVTEAKSGGKNLLIVFTGTEWIEMCRKFHDDILIQPGFMNAVSGRFALLRLEYPKDNKLPREEAAQKALLKDAYRVKGFPTVVMTDAEGRPFGLNGFQSVTPEAFAEQIMSTDAVRQSGLAALKEAESLAGIAKAKRMLQGIPDLPGNLAARYYRKEMEMIMAGDPEDTLGVAGAFTKLFADVDYSRLMQELSREAKWAEMVELTDRYILENKLEGNFLQKALFNKAGVQRRMDDISAVVATLKKIVEINAKSEIGIRAREQLDEMPETKRPEN